MPQLDKVTFLSQFFWLCVFYLGFFYIILKYYLPKIGRILDLRRKKMGFSHQLNLQQENQQVRENYETLLSRALVTGKNLFNNFFSRTTNWLNTNATSINKTNYQNVNTSYTQLLGETSLAQNIFFYHAQKNLPERYTFQVLLKNLHNRASGNKSQTFSSATKTDNVSDRAAAKTKKNKKS